MMPPPLELLAIDELPAIAVGVGVETNSPGSVTEAACPVDGRSVGPCAPLRRVNKIRALHTRHAWPSLFSLAEIELLADCGGYKCEWILLW